MHAKKGDNSASNTDQGSVVSDSINILISEAASISVSVSLSEVSESTTASLEASTSESEVVEEPAVYLTESESQASTSEEMIFEGVPENINSWNRLSET
ncbi:MAG: 1,6-alpha-glucanhydrolase, partial [Streptococcus sp.]